MDIAHCNDLPVTLVFLPAHDIAMYVGEGNVDIGITGLDVVRETSSDDEIEVAMVRGTRKRFKGDGFWVLLLVIVPAVLLFHCYHSDRTRSLRRVICGRRRHVRG